METKLARIAEIARTKPKEAFTSLYHYLNEAMLLQSHKELSANKAAGIDEVTKEEYAKNLEGNIKNLVEKLKKHSYKPQPVRRVYIPKDDGQKRPLGIAAYEDKIVQQGLKKILQTIYEADFLNFSYGFRPGRSCHDALVNLDRQLKWKTSFIVDVDIKGFFDNVSHEWMMKFIGVRIADPNIKWLILKFLKAGVMNGEAIEPTETGTPQGAIISPLLANIYLHYALDLWYAKAMQPRMKGAAALVRYADDFVCCFLFKEDAERFYTELQERLGKFGLEIAENKSKIIEFGRYAARTRKAKGLGKPETFDFLGFTHYCSQNQWGQFTVKRKTSKKKFKAKVKAYANWIKSAKDRESIHQIFETTRVKLIGHYNYYGITHNSRMIATYYDRVGELLYKWLNRRSQRKSVTWESFNKYLKLNPLPKPRITHRLSNGQFISVR